MFQKVKIKRTDTCLTFVLKRLGIYEKYKDLDGFEFAEKFDLEQIKSFDELNKGDIILADLSQYLSGTKGGIQSAMSMHLYFDYDATAYKFSFRVDGQPWWDSALTPFKGTKTQSPFITLAARA